MKDSLDTDKEDWDRKIKRFGSLLTHIASIRRKDKIIPSRLDLIHREGVTPEETGARSIEQGRC